MKYKTGIKNRLAQARLKSNGDSLGVLQSLEDWVPEWHLPYPVAKWTHETHKTCWNCAHLQVARFPMRQCIVHPEQHIYGCPFSELDPNNSDQPVTIESDITFGHEPNKTVADSCSEYQDAPGLEELESMFVKLNTAIHTETLPEQKLPETLEPGQVNPENFDEIWSGLIWVPRSVWETQAVKE